MRTFTVMRRWLALGLIPLLMMQTAAAQLGQLPDLGDPAQDSLSPAQEKRIAEEVLREVRFHEPSYLDDPEIEEYLSGIGHKLTSGGVTQNQNYQFFVLKDPTINAFAMPGGVIGVHTGLIMTTRGESELASVFGHEIGHVEQHHMARMLARAPNTTALMVASMLLAVLLGSSNPDAAGAALVGGQAAAIQRQLSYSRDYEREADRVGLQILYSAGFNPQGMTDFFERMYQQTRTGDNGAMPYLRTHPLTQDRIIDIAARIQQLPPQSYVDSYAYGMVREKIEVQMLGPKMAIGRINDRPAKTTQEKVARLYGLARAYLADQQFDEARKALAQLQALKVDDPMVAILGADIASGEKRFDEAARLCHAAAAQYPKRRTPVYCEAEAWLAGGKPQEALKAVDGPLRTIRQDYRLYVLQGKAAAALGRDALAHRAQAEVYALQGDVSAAIDQLQLAQRDRNGDYIEQASIDARLRELRAIDAEDKDKKNRGRRGP